MLLCVVQVLSFFFVFFFFLIITFNQFFYTISYMVHERKRIERNKLFRNRVEPITTLVSYVASHPSVAVLGSSDMPPRGWSSSTYPGTGAGPAETGAKLRECCSHLCQPEPSFSACVFWFNTLQCLH